MKRLGLVVAIAAIALLTFFQFPGHTWLQQDTQIYAPILENQFDPAVLRQDILVEYPHVSYTLYDEVALGLRRVTHLGLREVLEGQQIVTRALGIWGLYLMAESLGFGMWPSLLVAGIVSLGASITGPQVLTFEYEPTPRAFAVPLVFCAAGLVSRGRYWEAEVAGIAAFLYHAPTAAPFWALMIAILIRKRRYLGIVPIAAAFLLLIAVARLQGNGHLDFFSRLAPAEAQLQQLRASYAWVSTWPLRILLHYLLCAAVIGAAAMRLRRVLHFELRILLPGLALLGLLSMPASWILLEQLRWTLMPQFQPMRTLLFVAMAMQFLAAAAGVRAMMMQRPMEAAAWFVAAYVLPAQPMLTSLPSWRTAAVILTLAAATAAARRFAPAIAAAAFFVIPAAAGVTNYPNLHTPELADLSRWAKASTARDSVFLFAGVGRSLDPGIFRSEALRAIYVDWKGGGQVNYVKDFGKLWWDRWQQTLAKPFRPADMARYPELGITHVVLGLKNRLPQAPVFSNGRYLVYETTAVTPQNRLAREDSR